MSDNYWGYKPDHPKTNTALTLGIISLFLIITNCFCGLLSFVSFVLSIMSIVYANQVINDHQLEPKRYSEDSIKNAETSKILGIIGVVLSSIIIVIFIALAIFYGFAVYFNVFDKYN